MTARRFIPIAMPWLLIVMIGLLAAGLRYGLIESRSLAHLCEDGNPPNWCSVRLAVVMGFSRYGYGIAAIIATVLAMIWSKPWLASLAATLGMFALVLYCYDAGAVALLIGSLRLVRLQTNQMAAPGHPDRHGNRQIQPQP